MSSKGAWLVKFDCIAYIRSYVLVFGRHLISCYFKVLNFKFMCKEPKLKDRMALFYCTKALNIAYTLKCYLDDKEGFNKAMNRFGTDLKFMVANKEMHNALMLHRFDIDYLFENRHKIIEDLVGQSNEIKRQNKELFKPSNVYSHLDEEDDENLQRTK